MSIFADEDHPCRKRVIIRPTAIRSIDVIAYAIKITTSLFSENVIQRVKKGEIRGAILSSMYNQGVAGNRIKINDAGMQMSPPPVHFPSGVNIVRYMTPINSQ